MLKISETSAKSGGDAAQHQPRREPRFSAPFFALPIKVELFLEGIRHVGHLWDFSSHGACIRTLKPIPVSGRAMALIHEPSRQAVIETDAELVWTNEECNAHYIGLRFPQKVPFEQTFLKGLMQPALG